ncbi:MAG: glycosyltransferase [Candidatus Bathyarchaeia archaeon]|jgi:glycosyltransferase involved in cell wall biosynthesis
MKSLIISYFFPPGSTGAATVMYNFCKHLPQESYVTITAGKYFSKNLGAYDAKFVINGDIRRLPINDTTYFSRFRFLFFSIVSAVTIRKKIDCIIAVYPFFTDLFSGFVISKITKRPLVVYMHDLFSENKRGTRLYPIWLILERIVLKHSSSILVMNNKYVGYYRWRGINNLVLFPPTINSSNSGSIPSQLSETKSKYEKIKTVFTGSAYGAQENAILYFLDAAKSIKDVEVVFATPMTFGLTKLMKESLKEVNLGFLSKKDCLRLQSSADVLLLPLALNWKRPEEIMCAFPCKLLEYLAAAKPILAIVPDNSFVASFVRKHDIGIVVTKPSIEEISQALEKLKDPKIREKYSANCREAVKLFDSKIWAEKLESILEDIYVKWRSKQ